VLKSPTSRWVAGAAGVCAALLVLTWFVLVGPKRAEAADLTEQAASARQQNDSLQIRTAQLKAQFASLPQRQAELTTLVGQMPVTADVPRFVRSLDALAASSGVTLEGLTPGAGARLDAAGAAVGAAGATGATTGATGATTGATGATGAVGAAGSASAPASGAAGGTGAGLDVVQVPMTITVKGPYFATVTFLKGLQTGQRAFLVGGLQVAVEGKAVSLTIQGRVFALPGAAAALAATTAAKAATGATSPTP
jgi:type IV pilus assembly protein PilO